MRIERWADGCRGRRPLLLGVAALGLYLAGEWLVGGGCEYTMQPDGLGIANNAGWHPETPEGLRVYRMLVQLHIVFYVPLAALWLGVLVPALWSRAVRSARLVFALTLVAWGIWSLTLARYVLSYVHLWVETKPLPPEWVWTAQFTVEQLTSRGMTLSALLLFLGLCATLIRGLHTWVTSGPGQVQA
jgi:hypothetical protein